MTAPASKLLQPITVGPLELKNRIMFPPLTTGYEERDGSIGERSLAFYERLARGGVSYIVIGDVAPVMTASPTPKLATDAQIPTSKALADAVHKHGAKVALQLFHPEYDVPGVGRMVMGSMAPRPRRRPRPPATRRPLPPRWPSPTRFATRPTPSCITTCSAL